MLRRFLHLALGLALLAANAPAASATTITPAAALERVLTAPAEDPAWFSPALLAQVPASRMTEIVASIGKQLGTFERVTGDGAGGNYVAVYSGGTIACVISLDAAGIVDGIFFKVPQPTTASLGDALARFGSLHGTLGYVVTENGTERAAHGQDEALGVGSTFKLAVLTALVKQIAAGKRRWSDVVQVRDGWKSLPSGFLQTWPDGSHVTLETLASLMISISDNSATDLLIHTLGRAAIEPYAGANVPLLTTHDMFALKTKGAAAARKAWRSGDARARRRMIAVLDGAHLSADALDLQPADDDIDWQFTNRQLCALMAGVRHLPLFEINPGVATPSDWKSVAYKGGSDAGIISMTTWLVAKSGKQFCVSVTLDDATAAVDENAFSLDYLAVIDRLRDEAAKP